MQNKQEKFDAINKELIKNSKQLDERNKQLDEINKQLDEKNNELQQSVETSGITVETLRKELEEKNNELRGKEATLQEIEAIGEKIFNKVTNLMDNQSKINTFKDEVKAILTK